MTMTAEQALDLLCEKALVLGSGGDYDPTGLAETIRAALSQRVPDVDWLSNVIRQVDGNNSMGAGALAEAIVNAILTAAPPALSQWVPEGWRDAMKALLDYAWSWTCMHENTHRGGAIWTICDDCGQKWADDEGGMPGFAVPAAIQNAEALLTAAPAQSGDSDDHNAVLESVATDVIRTGHGAMLVNPADGSVKRIDVRRQMMADHEKDAEIALLREDAGRYYWLRDECKEADIIAGLDWIASGHKNLDAAIDAARLRGGDV